MKRRRKIGPAIKFTPAKRALVVEHIANGVSKDDAARAVGVHPATFYGWQAKHAAFARAVSRAEDALKPKLIAVIASAALAGDWRAALALARAKWPEEFNPPQRVQHGGDPSNALPIPIDPGAEMRHVAQKLAALSTEELRALAPVRRPTVEIS